jgi:hypothetical protein
MVMNDLSIFPADIAEMSIAQLASLPTQQLYEVDANIDKAITWLKGARTKVDAALEQRFGQQGREALRDSARDFGTAHFNVDGVHVKYELPKKVSWDQKKLKAIAERIVASGESVESYLDVKLAISETRYTNWPPSLQQQFADARTVDAGKATFELSCDEGGV